MQTAKTAPACKYAHMDDVQKSAVTELRAALEILGVKPAQLAKMAGVAPSTITRPLKAGGAEVKHAVSLRTLHAVRALVTAAGNDESQSNAVLAPTSTPAPAFANGIIVRDIPVLGGAQGGEEGAYQAFPENIIDYAERPYPLRGAKNVFAIYVVGDSMDPWAQSGDLIYVSRDRPVTPGCFVLAEVASIKKGDGPRSLVKRLVRRTAAHIELEQFNPRKIIKIAAGSKLYRVYDFKELAGLK
jgi:phage repressor protein C with HTH and peptisase S24 domain